MEKIISDGNRKIINQKFGIEKNQKEYYE